MFAITQRLRSDFRLLLTGTPLQNNIEELLTLLAFVNPVKFNSERRAELLEEINSSLLASRHKKYLEDPIARRREEYQQAESAREKEIVDTMHDSLRPHLLRRLKRDVLKKLP